MISVLVPCYNQEKYICDCLDSLLNQTYCDCEIVIGDDCSLDNTWEVIKSYEDRLLTTFRSVIMIHNANNLGVAQNLNVMLRKAHGDYIKYCSGDDFLLPNAIELFSTAIQGMSNVSVLFANGYIVSDKASFLKWEKDNLFYKSIPDMNLDTMVSRLYWENFLFSPSMFVKRELYEQYGYYNESIGVDDWNQLLLWATRGVEFGYIDSPVVCYRINDNSMTSLKISDSLIEKRAKIYDSAKYVINYYREYVTDVLWAQKMLKIMNEELRIAVSIGYRDYRKKILTEIKEFDGWRVLGIWDKLKICIQILKNLCYLN